jgi:hypothetical protein
MADPTYLNIDEIFFPVLEVRMLANHVASGIRSGTQLKLGRQVKKLDNQPGKWALAMSVASDDEKSTNPPYKFLIEAHAIVNFAGTVLEGEAAERFIESQGAPLLLGAIRERLAELTSRSPWGRFMINGIPLSEPVQVSQL